MNLPEQVFLRLVVALAVGTLIGIEREYAKGEGPQRAAAGVRTFALISLAGALSLLLGELVAFVAFAAIIGVLVAISYARSSATDPGLTTEVATLVTFLLGGLALREPELAAGLAVIVAIILAARTRVHGWIRNVLTGEEIRDGLTLAAAALVILPMIPEKAIDPWGIVQPRKLWTLAVLIMAINGLGYIALRALGPKIGLALAGLFSGFVSSTATIGAMGARARKNPELHRGAVAGAAASSVATIVQLAIVVGLVDVATLRSLLAELIAAGAAALAYAALFTFRSVRDTKDGELPAGRPFDPKTVLVFVAVVGVALLLSAALSQWLGDRGALLAGAVAGFGDTHAAAISVTSLAAGGRISVAVATLAVLIAFTTNACSRIVVAFSLGGRRYALALAPGIVLTVLAAWAAWLAGTLSR
jgi:uncharacterized membrane protein (DUF4010 family)